MSTDTSNENGQKRPPTTGVVSRRNMLLTGASALATASLLSAAQVTPARAQPVTPAAPGGARPNIVIIWGDDIGQSNISAYSHGLMGYQTPNIDRIAKEGLMF